MSCFPARDGSGGIRFDVVEMLEFSITPIGANRDALLMNNPADKSLPFQAELAPRRAALGPAFFFRDARDKVCQERVLRNLARRHVLGRHVDHDDDAVAAALAAHHQR